MVRPRISYDDADDEIRSAKLDLTRLVNGCLMSMLVESISYIVLPRYQTI